MVEKEETSYFSLNPNWI